MLTFSYLRSRLSYDPATGEFTWRNGPRSGLRAGTLHRSGYIYIHLLGKNYRAHGLAWLYVYGYRPERIDHKDRNPTNNSIDNLRPAHPSQNAANSRIRKTNKSGLKGVSFRPSRPRPWRAQLMVGGKQNHIGYFATKEEAHHAYLRAATEAFGEFASDGKEAA